MKRAILAVLFCLVMYAAAYWAVKYWPVVAQTQKPSPLPAPRYSGVFEIQSIANEPPQFKRKYRAVIEGGWTVKIEMYSTHSSYIGDSRRDSSELDQAGGEWVLFDAKAVADKIIDRELYPKVQQVVDEILRMDGEFMASHPSQFTDERGDTWIKQVKK